MKFCFCFEKSGLAKTGPAGPVPMPMRAQQYEKDAIGMAKFNFNPVQ